MPSSSLVLLACFRSLQELHDEIPSVSHLLEIHGFEITRVSTRFRALFPSLKHCIGRDRTDHMLL
ncbi:hypothetical protein L210DRAFT_3540232, partial [Boletus edulis BED1]